MTAPPPVTAAAQSAFGSIVLEVLHVSWARHETHRNLQPALHGACMEVLALAGKVSLGMAPGKPPDNAVRRPHMDSALPPPPPPPSRDGLKLFGPEVPALLGFTVTAPPTVSVMVSPATGKGGSPPSHSDSAACAVPQHMTTCPPWARCSHIWAALQQHNSALVVSRGDAV